MDEIELNESGVTFARNVVSERWVQQLRVAGNKAFEIHRAIQKRNNVEITTDGIALHVILNDDLFVEFLWYLWETGLLKKVGECFFKGKFILNSYGSLNSLPGKPNFSSIVHRDIRFFSGDSNLMLNMLVMLDDFTAENGATLLLAGSHKNAEKPTDEEFHRKAMKAIGTTGDILIFNSNVWHAAGANNANSARMGLTLTFSKSTMKQQLDYPRAIGFDKIEEYPLELQQLLGYHSRVPVSLDEWYQPLEKRFYRKGQD